MPPSIRGDLIDPLGRTQTLDRRAGDLAVAELGDAELAVRLGRHLRQVSDAQHLRALTPGRAIDALRFPPPRRRFPHPPRRTPCTWRTSWPRPPPGPRG